MPTQGVKSRALQGRRRTPPAGARPDVVVVLGMHRSGTSVVTRALQALGVALGDNLIPPKAGENDKGFFEDVDIMRFNDRLLKKLGSAWERLAPIDEAALTGPGFSAERREAASLLEEKAQLGRFGFKDPRTCVLLPLWQCVIDDLSLTPHYVLALRNPMEVAASLEARNGIAMTKGLALWAKHMIGAALNTQGKARTIVAYDQVLANPARQLERLAQALALPNPTSDQLADFCDAFLDRALRRQRVSEQELRRAGLAPGFVIALYELLRDGARGGADIDPSALQAVGHEYSAALPLFAYADALENESAELRADLRSAEELRARNAVLEASLAAQRKEAEQQTLNEAALAALTAERDDIARELAKTAEKLSAAMAEIDQLNQALAAEKSIREAANARSMSLESALEREREEGARALADAKASFDTAQIDLRASVAKATKLETRLTQAEKELARHQGLGRTLSDEVARARTEAEETRRLCEQLTGRIAILNDESTELSRQLSVAQAEIERREQRLKEAEALAEQRSIDLQKARAEFAEQTNEIGALRRDLLLARGALTATRSSTSWRLTAPLRATSSFLRHPLRTLRGWARGLRTAVSQVADTRAPVSTSLLQTPAIASNAVPRGGRGPDGAEDPTLTGCVELAAESPPAALEARAIAFYLPQFHPIPENDAWWGQGFTEWSKVRPAKPRFAGHVQPNEPGELGYYDLLKDEGIFERQAELAKLHGISGFCFYFYWFAGKRLLEAPIQKFAASAHIDMPFCLCWANENWTRRWDGRNGDVLVAQRHSPDDDIAFISYVSRYFRDPRYIRIRGRPLLLVYRPALFPDIAATAQRWRSWLRNNGFGEVYLAYTQSFENAPPEAYGFDAAIEFPPNNTGVKPEPAGSRPMYDGASITLYDWRELAERPYVAPTYRLFRGVTPQWDNTPRRPNNGAVFLNSTPTAYRDWLRRAVADTQKRFSDPEERLVFINAWNEWAEGAYLEPDKRRGYAWLAATRQALANEKPKSGVIIVTHDLHPHGAQFLALNIGKTLQERLGVRVSFVSAGGDGPLSQRFRSVARLDILDPSLNPDEIDRTLSVLRDDGFDRAIINSTASGWLSTALARNGIDFIGLIHELPGVIKLMGLEESVKNLERLARAVVYPADSVRARLLESYELRNARAVVRPQGLYQRIVLNDADAKDAARQRVCAKIGASVDDQIVLGVGYADLRKGIDIFLDWAVATLQRRNDVHFVWVGKVADEVQSIVRQKLARAGQLSNRIHLVGFDDSPGEYYLAASLYALSSREDPFPSTVLEALSAGTPVVMCAGTGGAENLAEHGCLTVLPNPEPRTFADSVDMMLGSRADTQRRGLIGRDLVRQRFGFTSYAGELADLLQLDTPQVSVIVPNYNYAHYLERRLSSILQQTLAPREIIVLDDASDDDSIAVAERVLAGSDINWRIVRNERNSGRVFSQWRKGAELATSTLLWIAEADDDSDPRFLETVSRAFRRGNVALAYTQSKQMDERGAILAADYLDYVRDVDAEKWRRNFIADGIAEVRSGLAVKNTIPNVSAVIFDRAKLLRVLVERHGEISSYRVAGDWCVYVNMLREGKVAYEASALNLHRRHDASVTISRFGLAELAEIARMQNYVSREFGTDAVQAAKARVYLQRLVEEFDLKKKHSAVDLAGAMRGVIAA